ncbi:MAG: helix-turn-helix domain-containing protein [Candidatus Diapherotrites archaeon]|nr:helix-turn-helix domain-containing protein [Candidatus Micrarchaeota archaeon]MBU1939341.1 helix-turn-helix domain-containing protein [Candidatus Micrarchaeota archaeon]
MKKTELVFLEIFRGARTQKAIAERLGISLSTVSNALRPLARIGAIEKRNFGFKVVDREKALAYWASVRNLEKDTAYKTRAELNVSEIEKLMPSGAIFTAFTAFRLRFKEVPADYGEVYVYAGEEVLAEIKRRFPQRGGPANLIVLWKDELLGEGKLVSDALMFVDLWNLREWYAKEFLNALKLKMGPE